MRQPGRDAYRGFEYQIRVSAWLALVFLVEKRLATAVTVEPLSGEDLEILQNADQKVDTGEHAIRLHLTTASIGRYIVQIKGRRTGHWTPSDLVDITAGDSQQEKEASSTRTWPIKVMTTDAGAKLLFVTDSIVQEHLSWFIVGEPVFAPHTDPLPKTASYWPKSLRDMGNDVLTRVGVLQMQKFEHVEQQIDNLLARELHVPYAQRAMCQEALLVRFRAAMQCESNANVDIEEIRAIARAHGGLPGGPDRFVAPKNWADLQRFLREKHAIVILGEPGVGKTTAAERLIYEHQVLPNPFRLVAPKTAMELRGLSSFTEPTIVYIEDPFGRHEPGERDDEWRLALERLCGSLRDDLKLVVTSRSAFADRYLDDEKATPRLRKYRVKLTVEDFDQGKLLREHLYKEAGADREGVAWIESAEKLITARLSRAFSYYHFVHRALDVPREERSLARMEQLIQDASIAELGKDLENTFKKESEAVLRGLVAIWVVLETWSYERRHQFRFDQLQSGLTDIEVEVSAARRKLIEYRWLEVRDDTVRMHPIYLEACLRVLEARTALTCRVIESILRMYVRQGQIEDVEAVFSTVSRKKFIRESMQRELGEFAFVALRRSASAKGNSKALGSALTVLAKCGQQDDPMVMLASALCEGFTRPQGPYHLVDIEEWRPPKWASEPTIQQRVAKHPDTPGVIRAFVKGGFPTIDEQWYDGASRLVVFLYGLTDVSAEFDAIIESINRFSEFSIDVIAVGAAYSKNANPDRLLERAIAELRAYESWIREVYPYDEDSYAAGEHYGAIAEDRRGPAISIVDAVLEVQGMLGENAWAATRSEPIVFERFSDRVARRQERDETVIRQVLKSCPTSERARLVEALFRASDLSALALELLPQVPSHQWIEILDDYLGGRSDDSTKQGEFVTALEALEKAAQELASHERISLAYTLNGRPNYARLHDSIINELGKTERATLAALIEGHGPLVEDCAELLNKIVASDSPVGRDALIVLAREGHPVQDCIDAWLCAESLRDNAIAALKAVAAAPSPKKLDAGRRGLAHPRADVRKQALALLAEVEGDESVAAIASVEEDPTGSVKIAVAKALAGRHEERAWKTLVGLLADAEDTSDAAHHGYPGYDDEGPEYGVAIAAARVLAALCPWPDEIKMAVDEFFASRASTRGAVRVVFEALQRV